MGERETQLDRESGDVGVSIDGLQEPDRTRRPATESRTSRLRDRATAVFSPRAFVATSIAVLIGYFVVGGLLPFGITNLLGIAAGTFLVGLVTSESRYVESAAAGAAVGGVAAVAKHLVFTLVGLGLPVVAVGAVGGLLAGTIGHYFGRDLRTGLTQEL